MMEKNLAVIRIRGSIRMTKEIKDTLQCLNLHKQNYCVLIPSTDNYKGMVKKAKDYITWGEIDDDTKKILLEKKSEPDKNHKKTGKTNAENKESGKAIKKYFRLSPPRKGFGRKGIKTSFENGGALGYRGQKINDLLRRMLP